MTLDQPAVVAIIRADILRLLAWAGPDVVAAVLSQVDAVQHRGDDHAFIAEAVAVLTTATKEATRPLLEKARAHADAAEAYADLLEAQFEKARLEFEEFRRMRTPTTIQ